MLRVARAPEDDELDDEPRPESGAERWTRGRVAKELGRSVASVRRLEDAGQLNPEVGERGVRLHDPEEVRELAARIGDVQAEASDTGVEALRPESAQLPAGRAIAAEVFRAFEEGMSAVDVVIELELDPVMVEQLCARWMRLHGHDGEDRADRERRFELLSSRLARLEQIAWEQATVLAWAVDALRECSAQVEAAGLLLGHDELA